MYAAGVDGGYAADALANIQRRYFKQYPVSLPHDEEPSEAHLAAVDDDAPDEDLPAPNEETLGAEEYTTAVRQMEEQTKTIISRKARIKHWLAYQYMKDHDIDPKESRAHNPYVVLLQQLTCSIIEEEVKQCAIQEGTTRKNLAALWESVARMMFEKLDQEEKDQWAAQAKEEHELAKAKHKEDLEARPSTLPADRQRCIQGFIHFMQPIADLAAEALGWKVSVIAGGPEPAHDGRLNMISIHSGTTNGDVKMSFWCAEQARYKKYIVPIFGSFLQKCYTLEECHSHALPQEDGFEPLQAFDLADNIDFDSFEPKMTSATEPLTTGSPGPPSAEAQTTGSVSASLPSLPSTATSSASMTENSNSHSSTPSQTETQQATVAPALGVPPPAPTATDSMTAHPPVAATSLATPIAGQAASQMVSPLASPQPSPPPLRAPSPVPSIAEPDTHVVASDLQKSTTEELLGMPASRKRKGRSRTTTLETEDCAVESAGTGAACNGTGKGTAKRRKSGHGTGATGVKRKRKTATTPVTLSPTDSTGIGTAAKPLQASKCLHGSGTIASGVDTSDAPSTVTSTQAPKLSKSAKCPQKAMCTKTIATAPPLDTSTGQVVAQADAPDWFMSTLGMLQSEYSDEIWTKLVKTWLAFEQQEGYTKIKYLGCDSQPAAVKEWIA
ncbi:unnamed protein product [Cyclocybe aegerita]|uniref:Uncharacterized protein n=1 Tax=Cyclocybe aegerita TaxID=1973307 RepID=A0A8S0X5V5_CYCAE|nr:unnamed protein product [Cyclocybe aegerita]